MLIERYFEFLQAAVVACPLVQTFRLAYDKRGTYEGFIRGEVHFPDGSTLHIREFVDTEQGVDRLTYVYQYLDPALNLVFRYDNTGHHRRLGLASYPDHKHDGSESSVVSSMAPGLADVLREIQGLITPTT